MIRHKLYETVDFSVQVPNSWSRKVIVTFLEPSARALPQSVVVTQTTHDGPSVLVETYAKQQLHELQAQLPGFSIIKRGVATVSGVEVPLLVYAWSPAGGPSLVQFQVYSCDPHRVWTLTGTIADDDVEGFEQQFLALARTFTFKRRTES